MQCPYCSSYSTYLIATSALKNRYSCVACRGNFSSAGEQVQPESNVEDLDRTAIDNERRAYWMDMNIRSGANPDGELYAGTGEAHGTECPQTHVELRRTSADRDRR